MNNYLVSVIIPCFNASKTIQKTINSLLNQSFQNFCIVIIDDGSIDTTKDEINKFANFNKIKYYYKNNGGASSARNFGISISKSELITFVDSDDYLEKNYLKDLVDEYISKGSDIIISSLIHRKSKHGKILITKVRKYPYKFLSNKNDIKYFLYPYIKNQMINGPYCKLIKRSILEINQITFNEKIHLQEDLLFNLKVFNSVNSASFINSNQYNYVSGINNSVTSRFFLKKFEMLDSVHDYLFDFYKEFPSKEIESLLLYLYVKNVYASILNFYHKDCPLNFNEIKIWIHNLFSTKKFSIYTRYNTNLLNGKFKFLLSVLKYKNITLLFIVAKFVYIIRNLLRFSIWIHN